MEQTLAKLKITRDKKFGIGKRIGSKLWVHKSCIEKVMSYDDFESFLKHLPDDFPYEVLRWDSKLKELAFIECNDFNSSNEPIVGRSIRITKKENNYHISKIQNQPKDPLVYHSKWLFVNENYSHFDLEKSKKRSIEWKSVIGVDKNITSKIGRLSFWDNWLKLNNLSSRTS